MGYPERLCYSQSNVKLRLFKSCAISPRCIMLFANNLKPRVSRLMEHIAATDTNADFTTKITYGATLTGVVTGIIAVRMTVISEKKHHTCGA